MKHVIRSCTLSLIGLSALAVLPILFITWLQVPGGPDPDGFIYQFFYDWIIDKDRLAKFDIPFSIIAKNLFNLVTNMNISLLVLSYIMGLGWSGGSHYLNVDAPGKAKLYFIHWIIFTSIFMVIVLIIVLIFVPNYRFSNFAAARYIGAPGAVIITTVSLIYYFLMYYVGVVLGTARFARSSVLFANKLPISELL